MAAVFRVQQIVLLREQTRNARLHSGNRAALTWFTKRFGENLISPQHVIIEPDGDVAFRKEYYTGVVKPSHRLDR